MISKITKLKDFGVFQSFSWKAELPPFRRFNLIYGWNRSGKTTVSRIFASCEKKCTHDEELFKQYPEYGEFELVTDGGITVSNTDVATNILPIKVFNQDFIDANISFDPSNPCSPIFYVSEEDIEAKKKLNLLKLDKESLSLKYEEAKSNSGSAIKIGDGFRISVAQTITQLLTNKQVPGRYYSYDKAKVKDKIDEIGAANFQSKLLSDEDRNTIEALSRSEAKEAQRSIPKLPDIDFNSLFTQIKSLLSKKVVSELLQRLKDPNDKDGGLDEELNSWVKQGYDIHKTKDQFKKCLFCDNVVETHLFDSLARHFSKDYEDLQGAINSLVSTLKALKVEKITEKIIELYPDFKNKYEAKAKQYNDTAEKQNVWIERSVLLLEQKYNNPFDSELLDTFDSPLAFRDLLNSTTDELNKIILAHNSRVTNHSTEVDEAKKKLEMHTIAVALSEQDYPLMEINLTETRRKESEALEAINANNRDISELEKKNSNIGKAVKEVNKYLKEFFGREEILLELDENKKGYLIKRNGQPATNLSEGEKTAIAFSYFIVKVEEKEFKVKDGIIFIDDPISSFDSNFIYQCFSLISTHFKEVGQLFISTHNFQLFNLTKEWFVGKNNHTKKDNEKNIADGLPEKPIPCNFFMVENYSESDIRKARLVELDKTLRNYKSEYHFLFSLLNKFKDKDISYEDFYTIGNVARRFFDIFADFKIPDSRDQKQKMEAIVKELNEAREESEKISSSEVNRAYKLISEFSHNSDPTSAIEHKNKSESKDAINILLDIVKKSDQKHYEVLLRNTIVLTAPSPTG